MGEGTVSNLGVAAASLHAMERGVRRLSRHLSHGQTLGFQVVAGFVAVIELIGFEGALPMTEFFGQGRVDFAVSTVVSVIPKPVMTVAIIQPTRVIQDGVETDAMQRNALVNRCACFLTDISKPAGASAVFGPGFSNEQWPMITLVHFGEHF